MQILKQTFQPNTFNFLINTRHIDPDSNIPYIITKIRRHGQRIAVDRKILGTSPLTLLSLDSINALDALLFSLQSDPHLSVPTIFDELKAIFRPTFTHPGGGHNTSFAHPSGGHNTSFTHTGGGHNTSFTHPGGVIIPLLSAL
jgi:hypothetical protein